MGSRKDGRVGEVARGRLSPHQTGRADFPHPAFLETLAARHTQSTEVSSLVA
jgi:hypothetical protein